MKGYIQLRSTGLLALACAAVVSACTGDPGPAGPQGPEGKQGPTGVEGPAGAGAASLVATAEPALVSADEGRTTIRIFVVNYDGKGVEGRQVSAAVTPIGSAGEVQDLGGGNYSIEVNGLVEAGPVLVTVTSGSLTPAIVALRVAPGAASPSQSRFFVTGSPAAADGASGVWLRLVPIDTAGNLLGRDRAVTFAASSGSHATVSETLDEKNGFYAVKVTNDTAEEVEIKATIDDRELDLVQAIRFTQAPTPAVTLAAYALSPRFVAGSEGTRIIASVHVDGRAAQGRAPEFKAATGSAKVEDAVEIGNGLYSVTVTDDVAEDAIVTVRDPASNASTDVRLKVLAGAPAGVVGTFSPPRVTADTGESTLTVKLVDALGNELEGGDFSASIGEPPCADDAEAEGAQVCPELAELAAQEDGTIAATLTHAHTAGAFTVTVRSGDFESTAKLEVTPGKASALASDVEAHRPNVPADGVSPVFVDVTLADRWGNELGDGLTINATTTGAATFGAFQSIGSSRYRAKVTNATAETVEVQLSVAANAGNPEVLLTAGRSLLFETAIHKITATVSTASPTSGNPVDVSVTVTALDATPVAGATITLYVGDRFEQAATCTTDAAGTCSVSMTPASTGTLPLLAQESLAGTAHAFSVVVQ